jgi:hypothetical protein
MSQAVAGVTRDGTHSRTSRSGGALGSFVTVLLAAYALLAIAKRRPPLAAPLPEPPPSQAPAREALSSPPSIEETGGGEAHVAPKRRLPRFFTGTLVGFTTGIVLGMTAAILVNVANSDVRSAVIVGVVLPTPTPTTDGEYIARILVQDMNPNLAYADPEDVAALLAQTPKPQEVAPVLAPVEEELRDNAAVVFLVLGALTVASWALIVRGLSGGGPVIADAVVE